MNDFWEIEEGHVMRLTRWKHLHEAAQSYQVWCVGSSIVFVYLFIFYFIFDSLLGLRSLATAVS